MPTSVGQREKFVAGHIGGEMTFHDIGTWHECEFVLAVGADAKLASVLFQHGHFAGIYVQVNRRPGPVPSSAWLRGLPIGISNCFLPMKSDRILPECF